MPWIKLIYGYFSILIAYIKSWLGGFNDSYIDISLVLENIFNRLSGFEIDYCDILIDTWDYEFAYDWLDLFVRVGSMIKLQCLEMGCEIVVVN